jgi:hypothetical protein
MRSFSTVNRKHLDESYFDSQFLTRNELRISSALLASSLAKVKDHVSLGFAP